MAITAHVERGVRVPMRDGLSLRADLWRPSRRGRHPILLQRTPYDKSNSFLAISAVGLEPLRAVEAGYAVAIVDTRGCFASQGTFRPFEQEIDDGVDTIRWAAGLPFSDGNVCMYGGSYIGATQLLAAMGGPQELRAIAPHVTGSEYHDGWTYRGGALQLGFVLLWAIGLATAQLARRAAAGEDVAPLQAELAELASNPWEAYRRLPLTDFRALVAALPAWSDWLAHPERDAYWERTAIADRYERVSIPALHIGGWYDIFLDGTLRNFTGLRSRAATDRARQGQRLLIGPWAHGNPHDVIGEVEFGPTASQLTLDLTRVHLSWFDNCLGRDSPEDEVSRVRVFVMGRNAWRDEDDWPPTRVRQRRWYLRGGGRANGLNGDGSLTLEPPASDEPPDRFVYDPRDPVPTVGGSTLLPGAHVSRHAGPQDQRQVEARHDVLVYTSSPLEQELEVTGPITVTLYASSSAPDTDWTAKLVDVHPGGRALCVADGILRARYRAGLGQSAPLRSHEPIEYVIDLGATSQLFRAGHRLRLEVSSSNFPRFDRNPNTGTTPALATNSELTPALQRVYHDRSRSSSLLLSIA